MTRALGLSHEAYESKFELTIVMLCSMAGTLMQALDSTIANVALPHMQGSLQATRDQITSLFRDFYKDSPLVRIRPTGHLPQIQYVVRTNFCDLGFELAPNGRRLVLVSCLDNLLKGASGQAVRSPASQALRYLRLAESP